MKAVLLSIMLSAVVFAQGLETCTSCCFSGLGYVGVGYNVSFASNSGISNIIGEYNRSRPWLSEKMGDLSLMHGFSASFGTMIYPFMMELKYDQRSATLNASGVPTASSSNTKVDRELIVNAQSITLGLSMPVFTGADNMLTVWFGGSLDFVLPKIKTKASTESDYKEFKYSTEYAFSAYPTIMYEVAGTNVIVLARPYYMLSVLGDDYEDLNRHLNANTYSRLEYDQTEGGFSNFGIELQVVYYWSGFNY